MSSEFFFFTTAVGDAYAAYDGSIPSMPLQFFDLFLNWFN